MTIIYFGGRLDSAARTQTNPITIRGYDLAGNVVATIRGGHIESTQILDSGVAFTAYQADGTELACTVPPSNPFPCVVPTALAGLPDGTLYAATKSIFANTPGSSALSEVWPDWFRAYRRTGDRIPFPQLHGGPIRAVTLDASGHIYVGGDEVGVEKYILRKYNSSGTLFWSVPASGLQPQNPDRVLSIAVDSAGNVYTAGGKDFGGGLVRKYNSSGTLLWTQRPAGVQLSVCLDDDENVYSSGVFSTGYWIVDDYYAPWGAIGGYIGYLPDSELFTSYGPPDTNGLPVTFHTLAKWAATDGQYLASARAGQQQHIDFDGTFIISGHFSDSYEQMGYKKYTKNLVLNYEENVGNGLYIPFADRETGTTYFIGPRRSTNVHILYGATRDVFWHFRGRDVATSAIWTGITATQTDGVDLETGVKWSTGSADLAALYATVEYTTVYDGLSAPDTFIQYSGVDSWEVAAGCVVHDTWVPALALPFPLGVPTLIGDRYVTVGGLPLAWALRRPDLIRDYVGTRLQTIYRAVVDGAPPLTLPLASVQCRRTTGGIEMTLVVPYLPSAPLTELLARVGNDLIVYRGVRFASGLEQLDELVRVTLTGTRLDTGPHQGSLTLSGQADAEPDNPKLRQARGISYRNLGTDGSRRVRCEVDTYLRPGDTVDLGGGETLIVSDLVYNLRPDSALMEISEAAP